MIVFENGEPGLPEFESVISRMDRLLNEDAAQREAYYEKRSGKPLEEDVCGMAREAAKGTAFDGAIRLVSGHRFPDIMASKHYGIEVKSAEKDSWRSVGGSILESTRIEGVERIYLTFGKLGKPVRFLSRPYEQCMSGIAVTHYPRYLIDMSLKAGETIFDKMGVPYDELRKLDNPIVPVSRYYKSALKPGESLWWAGDDAGDNASPATIKLWSALPHDQQDKFRAVGYALFPEILGNDSIKKYNRFALWLVARQGVVCTNIRDIFLCRRAS